MSSLALSKQDIAVISQYIDQHSNAWYPQLAHIDQTVKPLVFYSTSEQYMGTEENGWPVPEYRSLKYFKNQILTDRRKYYGAQDTAASKILGAAMRVFDDAEKNIESLSSFFILLEGVFDYTGLQTQTVYNHYHPARGNNPGCPVSTYLMLSQQFVPVQEKFEYADFNEIGVDPPRLYNMTDQEQAETINHYCNLPELRWQTREMPDQQGQALRIDFNAHRYAHNVSPLTENIWVMFVFNDVKFKPGRELDQNQMRFVTTQL